MTVAHGNGWTLCRLRLLGRYQHKQETSEHGCFCTQCSWLSRKWWGLSLRSGSALREEQNEIPESSRPIVRLPFPSTAASSFLTHSIILECISAASAKLAIFRPLADTFAYTSCGFHSHPTAVILRRALPSQFPHKSSSGPRKF
jgi:hypothetical protein